LGIYRTNALSFWKKFNKSNKKSDSMNLWIKDHCRRVEDNMKRSKDTLKKDWNNKRLFSKSPPDILKTKSNSFKKRLR